MNRIELLQNILVMACADGVLSSRELEYLKQRREAWGIDEQEFERILSTAQQGKLEIQVPSAESDRRQLLEHLVEIMAVDGIFDAMELKLFQSTARHLGFSQQQMDSIIDAVIDRDDLLL